MGVCWCRAHDIELAAMERKGFVQPEVSPEMAKVTQDLDSLAKLSTVISGDPRPVAAVVPVDRAIEVWDLPLLRREVVLLAGFLISRASRFPGKAGRHNTAWLSPSKPMLRNR